MCIFSIFRLKKKGKKVDKPSITTIDLTIESDIWKTRDNKGCSSNDSIYQLFL